MNNRVKLESSGSQFIDLAHHATYELSKFNLEGYTRITEDEHQIRLKVVVEKTRPKPENEGLPLAEQHPEIKSLKRVLQLVG